MAFPSRRAAITGAGVVTALTSDVDALTQLLNSGATAIRAITRFPTERYGMCHGAELADEDTATIALRWMVQSARAALAQAGMDLANLPRDLAVVCGTTAGEAEGVKRALRVFHEQLPCPPEYLQEILWYRPDVLTHAFCDALGIRGPRVTLSNACATGLYALDHALDLLNSGGASAVLVCAVDILNEFNLSALRALRVIARTMIRPFDVARSGTLLGDGAGALVLQPVTSGMCRATSYIYGAAVSCEAFDLASHKTDGSGMASTMRAALAGARLQPEQIAYLNTHGTGTLRNDESELQAIAEVFACGSDTIVIGSTKAAIGHTGAASGIIETIITASAIAQGIAPPTLFHTHPDPAATVGIICAESRPLSTPFGMCNAFGFGGANGSVIVSPQRPGAAHVEQPARVQRVLITGIGSCTSQPQAADAQTPISLELPQFDLQDFRTKQRFFGAGGFSLAALAAATRAVETSGLALEQIPPSRIGVILGTCYGSATTNCEIYKAISAGRPKDITPLMSVNSGFNAAGDALAVEFGAQAFSTTVVEGELSSLHALAIAACRVQSDHATVVLNGGADVLVSPFVNATLAQRGMESGPWQLQAGAVCLVVESYDSALQRAATPLFECCAWHFMNLPADQSACDVVGAALRQQLEDHQCSLDDLGLIVSYNALPRDSAGSLAATIDQLAQDARAAWLALDLELDHCGGLAGALAVAKAQQWIGRAEQPVFVLICGTDLFDQIGFVLLRTCPGGLLDGSSATRS